MNLEKMARAAAAAERVARAIASIQVATGLYAPRTVPIVTDLDDKPVDGDAEAPPWPVGYGLSSPASEKPKLVEPQLTQNELVQKAMLPSDVIFQRHTNNKFFEYLNAMRLGKEPARWFATLPWPPSEAEYLHPRMRSVTAYGEYFRRQVAGACAQAKGPREFAKLLRIELAFCEPTRPGPRRDITRYVMPVLDALKYVGVWVDHSQVSGVTWTRKAGINPDGDVDVTITEAGPA